MPRHPIRPAFRATLLLALIAATLAPQRADGQAVCGSMEECPGRVMDVGPRQELAVAGMNALLGGMTVAASRLIRGEPVWDGLWSGFLGGGAIYLGKRVAVEEFGGAGLLGREIASVGGSMIRNASAGRGAFDEVVLPVGPVRLYVADGRVVPRLDVASVAVAGAMVASYGARPDLSESLSAGAIVLRGDGPTPGLSSAGVLLTWSELPASEGPRLLAHERVHVLQYDQAFLSWAERPERWLARRSPVPSRILDHLDIGGLALVMRSGLNLTVEYSDRPWETEAYLMSQIVHPVHVSAPASGASN